MRPTCSPANSANPASASSSRIAPFRSSPSYWSSPASSSAASSSKSASGPKTPSSISSTASTLPSTNSATRFPTKPTTPVSSKLFPNAATASSRLSPLAPRPAPISTHSLPQALQLLFHLPQTLQAASPTFLLPLHPFRR